MPTYDYECTKCGKRVEVFHGMTEEPQLQCEECQTPLRKLIGAGAGIIFKGSGFYCTDYRSKDYQQKARKEAGGPATEQSGDSQPASGAKDSSGDNTSKSAAAETAKTESKTAPTGTNGGK